MQLAAAVGKNEETKIPTKTSLAMPRGTVARLADG